MEIVMAEEDDEVLELEKEKEGEEGEEGEGGSFIDKIKTKISEIEFTTELIIKIVIGFLVILLIALAAYFFMPKEEPVEASSETVEQEATMAEAESTGDVSGAIEGAVTTTTETADLSGAIEGTVTTTTETADLSLAATDLNLKDASGAESAELVTVADEVTLEMFKLREQVLMLEDENRRLKQRVNTLQAQANMSDEPKKTGTPKLRKSEQESMPQPMWGDFEPLHQGP
jgi:cytoskeletal protein RodZ